MVTRPLDHEALMHQAIALARSAAAAGETPVGAVVVKNGDVIGTGWERTRTNVDVTAHAEVEAIRAASRHMGSTSLDGCSIYTTVEPCVLCGYAIRRSGIIRVVYGVPAGQAGAATSAYAILTDAGLSGWSAVPEVVAGVLAVECADVLGSRTPSPFENTRRSGDR